WQNSKILIDTSAFPMKSYPGQCVTDTLRIGRQSGLLSGRSINIEAWCPDVFTCFSIIRHKPVADFDVYAVLGKDGLQWAPLDQNLAQLLLTNGPAADTVLTLTFVELSIGKLGEPCWRFSTCPGENYLLYPEQFVSEDQQRLSEELEVSPAGLLVTVSS